MSEFGELIRKLRKDKGMTLEQVADKVNSWKGYICGIENGKFNPPSVKFIRKFARVFHYDETEMVRIAYVDKAPKVIQGELRERVFPESAPGAGLPLLNTVESGYSTRTDKAGRLQPLVDRTVAVPGMAPTAACVATVCDDAMTRDEGLSIRKGDFVILSSVPELANGSIAYVIYRANGRREAAVRQLCAGENGSVTLQAFQPSHPSPTIAAEDIEAVFLVVGRLELFPNPNEDGAVKVSEKRRAERR